MCVVNALFGYLSLWVLKDRNFLTADFSLCPKIEFLCTSKFWKKDEGAQKEKKEEMDQLCYYKLHTATTSTYNN